MKTVSIIIRTKNEEKWIKSCLNSLINQDYKNFDIIIVDNESDDSTLDLVKNHDLFYKIKIVKTYNYIPGKALNDGIKVTNSEIIVCISAHCIPSNNTWLSDLVKPLSIKNNIVATYGRQVPMPYSDPDNVRDLLVVFSKDERLQKNDYFFHNAHSAFFRKIWEKFPFSEKLTNIEDREFGKNLIDNGFHIYYNPTPCVYHYHGIHQSNNKKRLDGVIRIIRSLKGDIDFKEIPEVCSISHLDSVLFLPINSKSLKDSKLYEIEYFIDEMLKINSVKKIIIIGYASILKFFNNDNIIKIDREMIKNNLEIGVFELINKSFSLIENNFVYDLGIYFNFKNELRNEIENIKLRLKNFPMTGADIVFPALKDYGYYWYFDDEKKQPVSFEKTLKVKEMRKSLYKASYGLGSVFSLAALKKGDLLNRKIVIDEI